MPQIRQTVNRKSKFLLGVTGSTSPKGTIQILALHPWTEQLQDWENPGEIGEV